MTRPDEFLLDIKGLKKHFVLKSSMFDRNVQQVVHAVDGVDLALRNGEVLALVGESGCGKSTLGRLIVGLTPATEGEIRFDGKRIDNLDRKSFRALRSRIQVVFQDPFSSLNPRMKVREIIAEPLVNFGMAKSRKELDMRVDRLLDLVHLPRDAAQRFPHEFSGGQRQRIGIARALGPEPDLIVLDEAVSALDVSVKAQIINLLAELQQRLSVAMLFISHDLAIVENIADRVAVMYLGKIVEQGPRAGIFANPTHPYTQALLSAVPVPDPAVCKERIVLRGDIPSPINPPPGCRFKTRCLYAFEPCQTIQPEARPCGPGHEAACHLIGLGNAGGNASHRPLTNQAPNIA